MKTYKDLTHIEKWIYEMVERVFITNQEVKRTSFVKVLRVLINKYKIKSGEENENNTRKS